MISIFPFELKKLLQRKAAFGAFIIFLLAIFGLFYQHFFVGQISGYSADKIHGREAVAINRRIAEKYSGDLSEERVTNIIKNYVNPPAGRPPIFDVFSYY
ncbi:TPA: hypothetical protein VBC48_001393, partial [Streptococcus agalactiae]|nr:hypothetical protein [Streptococcus agalactiae]HEO6873159.1 hypothetical protein [Streptococcus agalactiae]HEO7157694.1 hypothetical protein [Streptococcus agalactiae]